MIKILYEDHFLLAVDKPTKVQTHFTAIDKDSDNVLDKVQREFGLKTFPLHRLDRATSGILVLVKDKEQVSSFQQSLQTSSLKIYETIVRGPMAEAGEIVRDLKHVYRDEFQFSRSVYIKIQSFAGEIPVSKHSECIFTNIEIQPITGRTHQLRRHLSKISRPIIGDKEYGDRKLNDFVRNNIGIDELFLHAKTLDFYHPLLMKRIQLQAETPQYFKDFQNFFH